MEERKLREIQIGTEDIFEGVILNVKRDQVQLPNGHQSVREYPIDQVITEIPAGKLDSKEEDRLHAAKRELMEETGITGDTWTDMGLYYGAPAYSDEKITMYLVQDLHMGQQHLDEDEFLNVAFVPMEELVEEILSGKITDGKTQAAILKASMLIRKQHRAE